MSSDATTVAVPCPPPPAWMKMDEYAAADPARQRLARQSKRWPIPFRTRREDKGKGKQRAPEEIADASENPLTLAPTSPATTEHVELDSSLLPANQDQDEYRWAILYENQRGVTLFSASYYSPLSLLPHDPSAFTLPYAGPSISQSSPTSRRHQPKITKLSEYPIPDGTWRWASESWMIDMRGDGEVQHDGFEYNWIFRRHKWRAQVGRFNAGGWVRRRRWVRLMVRPVLNVPDSGTGSVRSSAPPSVLDHSSSEDTVEEPEERDNRVWRGEETDWTRCHAILKRLPRDGLKLEMWSRWLGQPQVPTMHPSSSSPTEAENEAKGPKKQWSEDEAPLPSELAYSRQTLPPGVSLEFIKPVMCAHGADILRTFIYPDSRARFILLLSQVGLLPDLDFLGGENDTVLYSRDFWSYTSEWSAGRSTGKNHSDQGSNSETVLTLEPENLKAATLADWTDNYTST